MIIKSYQEIILETVLFLDIFNKMENKMNNLSEISRDLLEVMYAQMKAERDGLKFELANAKDEIDSLNNQLEFIITGE